MTAIYAALSQCNFQWFSHSIHIRAHLSNTVLSLSVSNATVTPGFFSSRTNSKICFSHRRLDRWKPQRTLNRSRLAHICPDRVSGWPYVKQNRLSIPYRRKDQTSLNTIQHCLWFHISPYCPPVPYAPFPVSFIAICLQEIVIPAKGNDN